jgi:pimeloyl-ACP methyl ester carboxylesterase
MKRCLLIAIVCALAGTVASSQPADQFFKSNGVRIRYLVVGRGEPVILIHGFTASIEMWAPVINELSRDFQVIALDCRGHGKSGKPHDRTQYGIQMVEDVVQLMDHLGIRKAHIAGYSMGGSIVMKMLIVHPERFLTATIGGSTGFRPTDVDDAPDLVKNLQSGMPLSEALIASAPPGMPKPSPEQREMMKRFDAGQDPLALAALRLGNKELMVDYGPLKTNKVPTLVLYGARDNPGRFAELRGALANGEFVEIEGAGHIAAVQSPQFAREMWEFLRRHSSGR